MARIDRLCGIAAVALLLLAPPALAQDGGVTLIERGTPDQGTSGAGNTARAQDAATSHFNSAGMTRLERSQLMSGVNLILADVKFGDRNTTGGTPRGNTNGGGHAAATSRPAAATSCGPWRTTSGSGWR